MKGCRSITTEELRAIRSYFNARTDPLAVRDYTLFFFSLYTGLRISETLSIYANDIFEYDKISDSVYIRKANTKGKVSGKNCLLNKNARDLLRDYFLEYNISDRLKMSMDTPLFFSRKNNDALSTRQASRIFFNAFKACEMTGKVSTHSTRKTFCKVVYEKVDRNILDLQVATGHKNLSSLQSYIEADNEKVENALGSLDFTSNGPKIGSENEEKK